MLSCCISIDYLAQLEKTSKDTIFELINKIHVIAEAFGGSVSNKRSPLLVSFPNNALFNHIQALEAFNRIKIALSNSEKQLRGAIMAVHYSVHFDEVMEFLENTRIIHNDEYLYCISGKAKELLFGPGQYKDIFWEDPSYENLLGDADASRLFERPVLEDTIIKTLARIQQGAPRLVHLEAGKGPRNLQLPAVEHFGEHKQILYADGSNTRKLPFSPLTELVLKYPTLQTEENSQFSISALNMAEKSLFSDDLATTIYKGCKDSINTWLDSFSLLTRQNIRAVLVCNNPSMFSQEAFELVKERLLAGRGEEHYISISEAELCEGWAGSWAAKVSSDIADRDDQLNAMKLALGEKHGALHNKLKARFQEICQSAFSNALSAASLLSSLPIEASMYLYALLESQIYLNANKSRLFLKAFGLTEEGERLLTKLLSRAGIIMPNGIGIKPVNANLARSLIGEKIAKVIDRELDNFIIEQYKNGEIRPGISFFKRIPETEENGVLLYDCLFYSITRPDMSAKKAPGYLSESSRLVYDFWANMSLSHEEMAIKLAKQAENTDLSLKPNAVKALMKAELNYAQGRAEISVKNARDSMIFLGKDAPPLLTARSQRIMGLASLSLGKQAEATDYLTNSQQIAEIYKLEHERLMASYVKAIAEYLSGALIRAAKTINIAADSAKKLHRIDAFIMTEALMGRIELELGCYMEAAERFKAASVLAEDYNLNNAKARTDIWLARALAYAGKYDIAKRLLDNYQSDPEAVVFMLETEILGNNIAMANRIRTEKQMEENSFFSPPDFFNWESLFAEHEGKSRGSQASFTALGNYYSVLGLYTKGIEEKDPDCAVKIYSIIRSETDTRLDPAKGLYSLFCYLLEEALDEAPVDKQTVLSRGFKVLQERAGRIDDREKRIMYLEKNVWNHGIMEAARKHKFI